METENRQKSAIDLLNQLIALLQNFEAELGADDLRQKVQALVPVHLMLAELGKSLIPRNLASGARQRILYYFLKYPYISIQREELLIVAGIDDWARRVRELRVEHGWSIVSGVTAKQMNAEGEFLVDHVDVDSMRADDYIMIRTEQDRDAAHRWSTAKEIRNKNSSVRDKILEYLRENVGRLITGEELRYVAKEKTEWARRVRELRTEQGWPVVTKSSGRPDLPIGVYLLEQNRQSPAHDRSIPDPVRRKVLTRDHYQCQHCSWNHGSSNRSDPRHLEIHHIEHHARGGSNTEKNLVTLCTICHDDWHRIEIPEWQTEHFFTWLRTNDR